MTKVHTSYCVKFRIPFTLLVLALCTIVPCNAFASATDSAYNEFGADRATSESTSLGKLPLRVTTLGFGGTSLKITKFNDQIAVMSGGRGVATINHRFTVGGAGYGIVNRVEIRSEVADTFLSVGMGYGGLELGYLLLPDDRKANVGVSLLIAGGAAFIESLPKRRHNPSSVFPVFEPALYGEVALSKLIRIHAGATYRYVFGSDLPYISDNKMKGISGYANILFGTCNCE